MPLPQDIRPAFQVLWVGCETGTWASLHHWKKGFMEKLRLEQPAPVRAEAAE